MQNAFLLTPIEYLKGVGPQRAELLQKELGIFTYGDLLTHFPFRYVDRTRFYKVNEINADLPYVQLKGRFIKFDTIGQKRAKRFVASFRDETGTIELVWFQGIKWVADKIDTNTEFIVFGKPNSFNGRINIVHPEIEPVLTNQPPASSLQAVYHATEKLKARGLDSKAISRLTKIVALGISGRMEESLPPYLIKSLNLISKENAFKHIHLPENAEALRLATFRLKFEELFYSQLRILKQKTGRKIQSQGFVFENVGDHFNDFYNNHLPFPLTNAQKRVIKEIRNDLKAGKQMNRLLQGDVGSGKTIVAMLCMLLAMDNGFQSCLMAPTEILASQHFQNISELLKNMPVTVQLLTGSTKQKQRKVIFEDLQNGKLNIIIGTHALLEDTVQFKNLGLSIIDEQHRFGVQQRSKLWQKNSIPPHILVMTATPIPRTLAMTLYGDLDVSVIDELPPGRKPITTMHRYDSARAAVFSFMKTEIEKGRQVYVVYPLIKESEKMDYKDLMDGYESISRAFPQPQYQVSIVHGKMKPADKDFEMQRFIKNETQIMVATTVIEVGVNVPNASVMIIESAERFGLSQLHQLRGRVGRGADQSYCILMTSYELGKDTKTRMETMVRTNDGFEIADVDLRLRGPGDIEGTQQSGLLDLKIADLAKDVQILHLARDKATEILESDPLLENQQNHILNQALQSKQQGKFNWSRIS